jgi:hypothetical protein
VRDDALHIQITFAVNFLCTEWKIQVKWLSIAFSTPWFCHKKRLLCAHSALGMRSSQQLVDTVRSATYCMKLWIRAMLFVFVERQSNIDPHVTRIRPSTFIWKEHHPHHVHFHHSVKLIIIYLICSLINCMVSRVVVGGPHISSRDSQVYFDMMVVISKLRFHRNFLHNEFYRNNMIPPCRTNILSVACIKLNGQILSPSAQLLLFLMWANTSAWNGWMETWLV